MAEIGRLLTAMVTPFDEKGAVDFEQAKKLAHALLDSGSDGVVLSGTTGESPTLTTDEKMRLFSEVKQSVGDKGVVIAGTGTYSTAESIELSQEAEKQGVDGLLLVVPYYNKPPQEGMYQHFKAIAGNTNLPCIVYNIMGRTGVNMTDETTIRLSQIDNIVGTKEASGDMNQIARIIQGAGPDFRVWSGDDNQTFLIMSMGGYGVVSVVSHLVGNQIKHMMGLLLEGDIEGAATEHRRTPHLPWHVHRVQPHPGEIRGKPPRSECRRTQAAFGAAQRESSCPDREITGRIRYGPASLGLDAGRKNRYVGAGL